MLPLAIGCLHDFSFTIPIFFLLVSVSFTIHHITASSSCICINELNAIAFTAWSPHVNAASDKNYEFGIHKAHQHTHTHTHNIVTCYKMWMCQNWRRERVRKKEKERDTESEMRMWQSPWMYTETCISFWKFGPWNPFRWHRTYAKRLQFSPFHNNTCDCQLIEPKSTCTFRQLTEWNVEKVLVCRICVCVCALRALGGFSHQQ